MAENSSPDFTEFDERTAEVWNRLAEWWDDKIGDGNDFQNFLIEPTTERMLELRTDDRMLDIACGAGRFARCMASLGAIVVAIDHSEKFIQRARERTTENADRIEYRTINAADTAALMSLGEGQFDAAVCTMALMDMSSIEPLISTLPRLLKPGRRFVFLVMHPAFNSGTTRNIAEESYQDGKLVTTFGVTVTDYSKAFAYKGIGILGQPEPQYYFHRPISMLFNTCFKHGFVLDWMEEPTFPEGVEANLKSPLNWLRFHLIPPVLVARMRLM